MFSIEKIVHMNDLKALKGARLKLVGITLVNCKTKEIATQRTFVTIDSARRYCEEFGAHFAGVFKK